LASELAALPLPYGAAVVHLSGALGLDVLEPVSEGGWEAGSFHPLQSFPVVRPPDAFTHSLVAVDATTKELLGELRGLAARLGARARQVTDEQRTRYHAAAVMGSNYLVALTAQAVEVLASIGWTQEEALGALLPLQTGVLQNLARERLPNALIGPIRRGDHETVTRQIAALGAAGLESSAETYRILGRAALRLAREAGLDEAAAKRIEEALTG
jgi:predicted short-subunit dehydrogenase-like oxidoreductase (DUF2520 family)